MKAVVTRLNSNEIPVPLRNDPDPLFIILGPCRGRTHGRHREALEVGVQDSAGETQGLCWGLYLSTLSKLQYKKMTSINASVLVAES